LHTSRHTRIPAKEIEKKIGYTFQDKKWLRVALTHSSYANESKGKSLQSNERLEFLGDALLGATVALYLWEQFPQMTEGELSKIRAAIVCESSLAAWARELLLGDALLLGKGESMTDGKNRPSILADAFEALIAAVYLDGGIVPVRNFIHPFIVRDVKPLAKVGEGRDYKTRLQEIVQKNKEETLEYILLREHGPDHEKVFVMELRLNSNPIGLGEGHSKKEAEQQAALQALKLMGLEE
jgi:ribonuclease-3